ncbi:MAG: alpha/beta hydrolase-fold protein [Kofleriaceae bacterium]
MMTSSSARSRRLARGAALLLLLATSLALEACASTFVEPAESTDDPIAQTAAGAVAIAVHYPTGWGHRITLRCGGDGRSWNNAIETTWTTGDVWRVTLTAQGAFECKPMFDNVTWAIGPNWRFAPGQSVELWPFFFHSSGRLTRTPNWRSNILNDQRAIWTYTPPSYDENPAERYPVVYMHDGQNLFLDSYAFGGVSWAVAAAMDQGARDGLIHEAIIIGVDNDVDRIAEYTPVPDPSYGGGNASQYLRFLIEELKPQMDLQLRTQPDADHTAILGSSLGGLVSVWAGLQRPDVFRNVGALSPSTWWANTWILGQSSAATGPLPAKIYLDSGDAGPSSDDKVNTAALADVWRQKPGVTVKSLVQAGASHSEVYWRQRLPGALQFLLGPR